MANLDPFTQVYQALRRLLLADPNVKAVFAVGNVPDLSNPANQNPIKNNVQNADMPELIIATARTSFAIGRTNVGHAVTKRYSLRLATGQIAVNPKLFPAQWALFVAFCRMHREYPRLGLPFVERVQYVDGNDAIIEDTATARGTPGWVTLLALDVTLAFNDDSLGLFKMF